MNEKAASNHTPEDKNLVPIELDDDQIEAISGGGFNRITDEYVCDKCGVMTECLGVDHSYMLIFRSPSCGTYYDDR